jgi:hypothetical protein
MPNLAQRRTPSPADLAQCLAARLAMTGRREISGARDAGHRTDDDLERRARSERSRRHCHLPAEPKPRHPSPRDTGAYVPEMAARIDSDRNLTDGAKLLARIVTSHVYRKNREGREIDITVTYLMLAIGRCRRTVQRYLRQLERERYIEVFVVPSDRTRMCFGLRIRLLDALLPRHRRHKWPKKGGKPAATTESQNYSQRFRKKPMRRALWAFLCCDGVWRSYMKTLPPLPALI